VTASARPALCAARGYDAIFQAGALMSVTGHMDGEPGAGHEGRPLDRRLHDRHELIDRHPGRASITARSMAGRGSMSTSACSTP